MISFKINVYQTGGIGALLCLAVFSQAAYADSLITSGFTLVNSNADGSVSSPSGLYPSDLSSFDLTGGNNGTGLSGQTDYIGTAPLAGIVQFFWSYTSCFPPNEQSFACDSPGFDWTGFEVDQILTQLTDTDTGGVVASTSFAVSAGDVFGWYVGTFDNLGEPGALTVSDVSFAPAGSVPEPGTLLLCIGCMLAIAAIGRVVADKQPREMRKI